MVMNVMAWLLVLVVIYILAWVGRSWFMWLWILVGVWVGDMLGMLLVKLVI